MTRSAKGFVPAHLTSAAVVMCDTAFLRHLAVLGEPYLRKVVGAVLGDRARIPPAVRMELNAAKTFAPAVRVLLPDQGLLRVVDLNGDQREESAALAELLPEKRGGPRENLGEAQAIILAQALGAPLLIDDGDGVLAARGRGVKVILGVHLLQHAALMGSLTDDEAWDVWERLCSTSVAFRPAWHIEWDTCDDCRTTFLTTIAAARPVRPPDVHQVP
jgi:predicted nucleic acid-binding protein